MKNKIFLSIILIMTVNVTYGKDGVLEDVAKGFAVGIAQEAGKRLMSTIIDGNKWGIQEDSQRKANASWEINRSHPVYSHVISTSNRGEWKPEKGYIWQNSQDGNDWSVMPIKNYKQRKSNTSDNLDYQVVYTGRDGVNVRSTPKGKHILATTYKQNTIPLKYISSNYAGNKKWKKFKITGWMVKKSNKTKKEYLSNNSNNIATITWDGDGDPRDNYVNLRINTNFKSKIVARVYTNTSVRVVNNKFKKNRKWVKVELIGWLLVKTSKGQQLLNIMN